MSNNSLKDHINNLFLKYLCRDASQSEIDSLLKSNRMKVWHFFGKNSKKILDIIESEIANCHEAKNKAIGLTSWQKTKKKLNIINYSKFAEHRSGWNYVMHQLLQTHQSDGVLFIDFIEKPFGWNYKQSGCLDNVKDVFFEEVQYVINMAELATYRGVDYIKLADDRIVKYIEGAWQLADDVDLEKYKTLLNSGTHNTKITEPWVGVLHNPPNLPVWMDFDSSPWMILRKPEFQQSLEYCKGIFVFSQYLADWLKDNLSNTIPVNVLYHPTELGKMFDFGSYLENAEKSVIQIGWWGRKFHSIDRLQTFHKKYWFYGNKRAIDELKPLEKDYLQEAVSANDVTVTCVDNATFDMMLSRNIAFVDLYDSSCNNTVIECIVRCCPILVNKIPAVVEYLGEDYPFYFASLEEASEKLNNMTLIKATHEYLLNWHMRHRLTGEYFFKSFVGSEIYRSL